MSHWFALYTRPRHEKQVFEELTRRGIESFLPTYQVRRRWSDRYKVVTEPLFKNYLFVKMNAASQHDTLRPYGAVSFVNTDGQPAQIPDTEIEAIRRLIESELPYNPYPYLKVGRKVRVTTGSLEGCEGTLVRKKGLTRLVLSIHMLQQSVVTEIDANCVEPR